MSLLLDALKKAAEDKQKASQNSASEKTDADTQDAVPAVSKEKNDNADEVPVVTETQVVSDDLTLQETDDLTLENLELEGINPSPENNSPNDVADAAYSEEVVVEQGFSAKERPTVSDEALSMLIYKTNRDVKKSKKLLIVSVVFIGIAVLLSGGFYYYQDMQAELASLERKHNIAMQSMRLKTDIEKPTDKPAVIRNLVGDQSALNEKVANTVRHTATANNSVKTKPSSTRQSSSVNAATPTLSIQKTNKTDPVGEKLESGWLAYESAQYSEAASSYESVLLLEENNRDALLGLAAIAVIEKNNIKARQIYMSLLEQDPRDPLAIAALSSLRSDQASLDSDKNYLLAMLERNPDAYHLSFALGNIYAQQNQWRSAQQHYFDAWQHNNDNADYLFNLAVSLDQLSKQEQAINFYKESLLKSENKQISFSRHAVKKRISELSSLDIQQ